MAQSSEHIEQNYGASDSTYFGPVKNGNTLKTVEPNSDNWVYSHRLDIGIAVAIVLAVIAIVIALKAKTAAR